MYQQCISKHKLVRKHIRINGTQFAFFMIPNLTPDAKEGYMLFLTTLPPTKKTAAIYRSRWKIESLFFHLKSNRYNLKDLNLRNPGKSRLLLALFALAYTLAVREGLKRQNRTPHNIRKDGSSSPEVSVFRDGLAILTTKCHDFIDFIQYILSFFSAKNHRFCKNVQ